MNIPDKSTKLEKLFDIRLLLVLFLLFTSSIAYTAALEWDEGSFLTNAEYFSGDSSNFEESRPAAVSYAVSGIWLLTGESTFSARFIVVLAGIGCIVVFHRIALEEFDEPLRITAVFAFSPLLLYWSAHIYTDVPALLFLLGSFYMFQRDRHFLAGILISIAGTVRYVFLVLAIGMGVGYILERRNRISQPILGGLMGSAPFLLYSKIYYEGFFARIIMYLTRVSHWSDSGFVASVVPGVKSGLFTLSGLIPALYPGWKDTGLTEKSMITAYTIFIIFISGNSYPRYWLAILPFLLLVAYRGLDRKFFYLASAIMLITSGFGVVTDGMNHQRCEEPLENALDYSSDLEGKFVSDSWAIAGYRLDKPVMSPWKSLSELRDEEDVKYAVLSSDEPYEIMKSFSNNCRNYYVYDLERPKA
ncbi:MAG: hypothetical protein BRC29_04880 [Nanohaloarchaea archaeon SW_7_43_1]|nr:MAG: hypothetical protein BRC29_04880 [Nanohaloarchaea archaeon SW_7_43_1]